MSLHSQRKEERKRQASYHTALMQSKHGAEIDTCVEKSKIYSKVVDFSGNAEFHDTEIHAVNNDSVTAILAECSLPEYGRTAVLNFASYKYPGGGFMNGSVAQEEALCHESFLYNVINRFPYYYAWNRLHLHDGLYSNRAIYSPDVCFMRGDAIAHCDVITCAAPNYHAAVELGNKTEEENLNALKERIKFILDIAADNGVETIILGAYGCGVFKQGIDTVASIFMEYLTTSHQYFKKVIFAVPNGRDEKYNKFKDAIEDYGV